MSVYQSKSGRWYYKFVIRGQQYHKSVPEATNKRDAEKAEYIVKAQLLQGKHDLVEEKGSMLFFKLIYEFEEYAKNNRGAWDKEKYVLNLLKDFWGNVKLSDISPFSIEKYRIKRKNDGKKPATINREVGNLRRMFNIAVQNGWAIENPALSKSVKPLKVDNTIVRFLTKEEEYNLLNTCEQTFSYLKPIIICALHTGMRRGEILGLTWDCVDFKEKYITLLKTKNNKVRKIPLSNLLFSELKKLNYNKTSKYVFTNPITNGKYVDIKKAFHSVCSAANILNLRFHDLRHTAATRMVTAGVDLGIVREILGHSDLKTTQRYAHPVPERKIAAINALESYTDKSENVIDLYKV